MNQLFPIFLILFGFLSQAQEKRVLILGEIRNDSLPVENAHVINLNSQKGSITNASGHFKITVAEKDTLMISDIQYQHQMVIINQDHLLKKFIAINLQELTNELDEVLVRQYEDMSEELGLPNAGKKPLNKLERNLNHYSQKSTPVVILEALLFKPGGIDDIYNIVSGNRKRDRKLKQLIEEDQVNARNMEYVRQMKEYFNVDFFVNSVHIQENQIDSFILFCLPKGIGPLYDEGRLIEVIDIFLKSREAYFLTLEDTE
jgi:hypothetical protein